MTQTFALQTATETGTYQHTIRFTPVAGDQVKITERLWDQLMGDWMGTGAGEQDRVVSTAEARAYYRDRRSFGYKAV